MHKRFEVATVNIKPIHTKHDYKAALKAVEELMNARAGSPEGDLLDSLVTRIQAYEAKHFPMLPPSPVKGELKGHGSHDTTLSMSPRRRPGPKFR